MSTLTKFQNASAGTGWNKATDKAQQNKWQKVPDADFALRMVSKHDLWIDHAYQRNDISLTNVRQIASKWNWSCVGAITVSDRGDAMVVIEGQHRVLAAMQRSEIDLLPCIVFKFATLKDEAAAFLAINTIRKTVTAIDKHRAGFVAEDENTLAVADFMEKIGLRLTKTPSCSSETKAISTIANLISSYGENPVRLTVSILMAGDFSRGLQGEVIGAVCELVRRNPEKIAIIRSKICSVSGEIIERAISNAKVLYGKGGHVAGARGLVELVNKGRRSNFVSLNAEA